MRAVTSGVAVSAWWGARPPWDEHFPGEVSEAPPVALLDATCAPVKSSGSTRQHCR